ncbi:MAG: hypothetical protein JST22_02055 [Bacteroidetes bacterium]|nr:hypothetical protein [Bacteroidota bacterium]
MPEKPKKTDDVLWAMLSSELALPEIEELRAYLDGRGEHYDMGYGQLSIEPYDARGGRSAIFKIRHARYGETLVSASALKSVLHDLRHHLLR